MDTSIGEQEVLELNAKEVEEKEKAHAAVEKRRLKKLSDEPSLSTPSKPDEKKIQKKGYAMIHVFIPRNILNYNCLYDIYHCVVSVMMLRIQILK